MDEMYFITEFGQTAPMIATQDITCWMLVTRKPKTFNNHYMDIDTSAELKTGMRYKQKEKFHITRQGVITNGFHTGKDTGSDHYERNKPILSSKFLVKCIIPRGAHYFHNRETLDYMSNEIIFGV